MKVIVCPVKNFQPTKPINEKEKKHFPDISLEKLIFQHDNLIEELKAITKVEIMKPSKDLYEQVFVRDCAFQIEDKTYLCKFKEPLRKEETSEIEKYLKVDFRFRSFVEGGDILYHNDTVYVGKGNRTHWNSIEELSKFHNVKDIELSKGVLHLDCVLNFLDNYAFVDKKGISKKDYLLLKKDYKIIKIRRREKDNLNTNFIVLDKTIIIGNCSRRLEKIFTSLGYEVKSIDFTEFYKLGGSIRCCTLLIN